MYEQEKKKMDDRSSLLFSMGKSLALTTTPGSGIVENPCPRVNLVLSTTVLNTLAKNASTGDRRKRLSDIGRTPWGSPFKGHACMRRSRLDWIVLDPWNIDSRWTKYSSVHDRNESLVLEQLSLRCGLAPKLWEK